MLPMALGALSLLGAGVPTEVILEQAHPVAVVLLRGERFGGAASMSELLQQAADAFESTTFFRLAPVPEAEIDRCRARFPLAGSYLCEVSAALDMRAEMLVVISGVGEEQGSQLRVAYLVLDGLSINERLSYGEAPGTRAAGQEAFNRTEAELFEATKFLDPRPARNSQELVSALRETSREIAPALRVSLRYANLAISVTPSVARVRVNDMPLPPSDSGQWIIVGLPRGQQRIEGVLSGYESELANIQLPSEGAVELRLTLKENAPSAWRAAGWTGVTLAAAGMAFAIYGLIDVPTRTSTYNRQVLARLVSEDDLSLSGQAGKGPILAGLSLGVGVTGLVLAVAGLTKTRPERDPWIEALLAVGGGILVYGAFEIVDEAMQ